MSGFSLNLKVQERFNVNPRLVPPKKPNDLEILIGIERSKLAIAYIKRSKSVDARPTTTNLANLAVDNVSANYSRIKTRDRFNVSFCPFIGLKYPSIPCASVRMSIPFVETGLPVLKSL